MLDSTRFKRHARISKLGGAVAFEPNIWQRGRLGGLAYKAIAPSGGGVSTDQNYTPVSVFTVNAWFNPFDTTASFNPIVDQWNETGAKRSWAIVWFGSDSRVYAYTSSNGTGFHFFSTTANTLTTKRWQMVTVVYGGSGVATKIYFNGVSVTSTDGGGSQGNLGVFATAQPIYIGHAINFSGGQVGARAGFEAVTIDERELSADEISWMFYNQFGRWDRESPPEVAKSFATPAPALPSRIRPSLPLILR